MMKTQQESVSICTVVSFDTSSRCELKIAMVHTVGSVATVTTLGAVRSMAKDRLPVLPAVAPATSKAVMTRPALALSGRARRAGPGIARVQAPPGWTWAG